MKKHSETSKAGKLENAAANLSHFGIHTSIASAYYANVITSTKTGYSFFEINVKKWSLVCNETWKERFGTKSLM